MPALKCQYCGQNVNLPFRCPFCGRYYCADHRLPEFHACQEIKRGAFASERPLKELGKEIEEILYEEKPSKAFRLFHGISSLREIVHLSLGTLIVALVGVSLVLEDPRFLSHRLALFSAMILVLTFILHELAHKFTAKYYGLWAEFRLSLMGVVITLISIFLPLVKIVSPGTVVISGEATRGTIGKISLSGPIVNIILSMTFLALSSLFNADILGVLLAQGSFINAFVALFNLMPFSILDGVKVIWWNKYFWTMSFLSSLMLVAINLII